MELLIIPISLSFIGFILERYNDVQALLDGVLSTLVIKLLIYAILGGVCSLIINITIKTKLENIIQFKTDLQSVIDFDICNKRTER